MLYDNLSMQSGKADINGISLHNHDVIASFVIKTKRHKWCLPKSHPRCYALLCFLQPYVSTKYSGTSPSWPWEWKWSCLAAVMRASVCRPDAFFGRSTDSRGNSPQRWRDRVWENGHGKLGFRQRKEC